MLRRLGIAVALIALCASCSTTSSDVSAYVRDGVSYGVTEGTFRGRWWNNYERGRSFSDGQFWTEAERDFRAALARRGADDLWVRTYGLHFLPEYFPHRELGIALYHQNRIPEAIEELTLSLSQRHSARGAYCLGLARLSQIKAGNLDHAPPTVEWIAPLSTVGGTAVDLQGVARDDTYVAAIQVNGEIYPVDVSAPEISFRHRVPLLPGTNRFKVAVTDLLGNRTEREFVVESDVDGPAVSFDSPVALPGTIRGVAMDSSGVTAMTIGGVVAALTTTADGLTAFSATVDLASAKPPLRYECIDHFGNATRGTLPVEQLTLSYAPGLPRFASFAPDTGILLAPGLMAFPAPDMSLTIVKAVAESPSSTPTIKIVTPLAGQVFHEQEVVVEVEIQSDTPLAVARVNDRDIPVIPGRHTQRRSRRLTLEDPGPQSIAAMVQDQAGNQGNDVVEIQRKLSQIEEVGRLDVAFLGCSSENSNMTLGDIADIKAIEDLLHGEFYTSGRFDFRERNASEFQAILAEQQLSIELSSKEEILALHQLVPAEMLLIGSVHYSPGMITIILKGKSTETLAKDEVVTMAYADVCGPAQNADQVRDLVKTLTLRFLQEFPRARGMIADVKGESLVTTLRTEHRVRKNMKIVVFRKGEPIPNPENPGEFLGDADTEILGEALLTLVREESSKARIMRRIDPYQEDPIERGYFVVTK